MQNIKNETPAESADTWRKSPLRIISLVLALSCFISLTSFLFTIPFVAFDDIALFEVAFREVFFRGIITFLGGIITSFAYALTYFLLFVFQFGTEAKDALGISIYYLITGFLLFLMSKKFGFRFALASAILSYIFIAIFAIDKFFSSVVLSLFFFSASFAFAKPEELGLARENIFRTVLFGIIAFMVMLLVSFSAITLIKSQNVSDLENVQKALESAPTYILFLAVSFGPVAEELFFRGLLIGKIGMFITRNSALVRSRKEARNIKEMSLGGAIIALVISSAIFSLAHVRYGSWVELAGALVLGLFLGAVYLRTKNILVPIIAHLIYNSLSIATMFF